MAKTDHVVFDFRSGAFYCESCGQQFRAALPSPIAIFVAAANAFVKMHRDCPVLHGHTKKIPAASLEQISERQP